LTEFALFTICAVAAGITVYAGRKGRKTPEGHWVPPAGHDPDALPIEPEAESSSNRPTVAMPRPPVQEDWVPARPLPAPASAHQPVEQPVFSAPPASPRGTSNRQKIWLVACAALTVGLLVVFVVSVGSGKGAVATFASRHNLVPVGDPVQPKQPPEKQTSV